MVLVEVDVLLLLLLELRVLSLGRLLLLRLEQVAAGAFLGFRPRDLLGRVGGLLGGLGGLLGRL